MLSQLDLNLMQELRLPGHTRIQVGANIDNVFDQDTDTAYYPGNSYGPTPYITTTGGYGNIGLNFGTSPPAVLYQPGGYDVNKIVADYIAGGGNLKANPFYKTPQVFQSRRVIRFQARITF
jgi:hypothetical protein